MAWSTVTAGGSATTWGAQTAGNPFAWIPYSTVMHVLSGVDFVPVASADAPARASADRPVYAYEISTITAAGFAGEGKP